MMEKKREFLWLDWIVWGILVALVMLAYTSAGRYLTVIARGGQLMFVPLVVLFFNHVDWKQALQEREKGLLLCMAAGVLVVINMFLAKAGPGVIFDIADLLLILYLSDKVKIDDVSLAIISAGFLLILCFWIKHDGSDYNANTISMIVFEATIVSAVCGCSLLSKWNKGWLVYPYLLATIPTIVWPIAKKFRGRTTLVAVLIMLFFFLVVPKLIWRVRALYYAATGGVLLVSLAVPAAFTYIYVGYVSQGLTFPPELRKFGGREPVWLQFFEAWTKEPWTGIGNDYVAKIPDLLFTNVHNGLLHILTVYGVLVFLITLILFGMVIAKIRTDEMSTAKKLGFSLIIAMVAMMTMESYVITAFSNLVFFFVLLVIFRENGQMRKNIAQNEQEQGKNT